MPEGTPNWREIYLAYVAVAWGKLALYGGVLATGASYLLERFDGKSGRTVGLKLLAFVLAFCIAGIADAAWRIQFAGVARRRYRRAGRVVDDGMRRLMRLSRLNYGTLLLQVAAAALVAWRVH